MKEILFLDDNVDRQEWFSKVFTIPNTHVDYLETADEAIRALQSKVYEVAFLDHVGGKTNVKEVEGSGYQVALFIERMPPEKRPYQVIIHSHNSEGARRMYQALKGSVRRLQIIPFASLLTALSQK